jgi:murein DD-endopeptidase MepM/ murein hydrolase activator NlpD
MRAVRRRLLPIVLTPLALIAVAAPGHPVMAQANAAPLAVLNPGDWTRVLPAPRMPDTYAPPRGSRVAWPVRGVITQPFGCTGYVLEHPSDTCPSGFHTGLDIAEPQGTPIRAAGAGLAYPFEDPARYGNYVIVQHVAGYATVYAHMVRQNVTWGQSVEAGDVIGFVGSTGNSSGPHLHFEVRFAATPYDPMEYLDGSPADPTALPAGWPGAPRDDWRGIR